MTQTWPEPGRGKVFPLVFPWVRHLRDEEAQEFAAELVAALLDAAELELDADSNAQEVITEWQADIREERWSASSFTMRVGGC
ncbi:MAG: hypothetical protein JO100_04935 [Pseudonocardia sp.]|nr:hypothetical protein [Pseudonocardia sp.]